MKTLDISTEQRGEYYHWYAIDIESRRATNEGCCSTSGQGSKCEGFNTEQLAKQAGDIWNKTRRA
jgi:hypothetical protein